MTIHEIEAEIDIKWLTIIPTDQLAVRQFLQSVEPAKLLIWFFQSLDQACEEPYRVRWDEHWETIIARVNEIFPLFDLPRQTQDHLQDFLANLSSTLEYHREQQLFQLAAYWQRNLRDNLMWRCHILAEAQS